MKKAWAFSIVIFSLIVAVATILYYFNRPVLVTQEIRISTNPWIGFTPFIYAQEKGWLEETPFKFVWMVDLSDNIRLYEREFTHGFTATQYEMMRLKNKDSLRPVFLIDRSFGADAIVSNRTVEELRFSKVPVTVYLERGSLNEDFFQAFIKEYGLEGIRFQHVDNSQKEILRSKKHSDPVLIISYHPYLSELEKKGYSIIASTRTMKTFLVVDALFIEEKALLGREKDIRNLQELFAAAVDRYHQDPQEYYGTIYGYLEGQSYEDFIASMEGIEWLYDKKSEFVVSHLKMQHIPTERLLP